MKFRPLPCKLFQQQPLREEISTIGISILVKETATFTLVVN